MSKFNINIIWVLFFLAFAESLVEEYYYRDIIDDGIKLEFFVQEMTPDRQIKIYYDNKLIITQRNTSTPPSVSGELKNLQIIVPNTETLMLNPEEINSKKKVYVYHSDGQIHVYQGEERLATENLVPEFNDTFDSGNTISILSNEFNQKKLVSIFLKNNKLVLTQVKSPEETNSTLLPIENLQTVTSDKNKLLLHPARFSSKKEINIVHENSRLIVWTGKADQIPNDSINTPEIVEVIISDAFNEFNTCFDTEETAEIFPEEFNMTKLVWIFFDDNNQLNVTQVGAPEETRNNIEYKYKNMTVVSSDVNKLLLYPARITPDDMIRVRHENRTIFIWQGSDQIPKNNINRPDIVKVIKPNVKELAAIPDKSVSSSSDEETILMVLPELNLKQSISININNNNNTKIETSNTPHKEISNRTNVYSNLKNGKSNPFVFYPINIDLDFKININDNKVPEKPELPKSNETAIKIDNKQPEPSMIHQTIISNYTMRINPKELISKKLVKVSYKNKLLEVTQIGTSDESLNPTPSNLNNTNIQIIKPDTDTLMLHLMFINSDLVIKIRHQDGKIYIWQGSDELPNSDIDMPSVVQVIGPNLPEDKDNDQEAETVVQDLNQSVSDKMTLALFSNMYNPDKLVVVRHENHQIHVNQIDRVKDEGNKNVRYEELHLSISNNSSATFDPRKINPSNMIMINYVKNKTHINTGLYKDEKN